MHFKQIEFTEGMPFSIEIQSIERSPIHYHEGVTEIILPLKGTLEVICNFEHNLLKEGEFFFVNNKCIHSVRSNENAVTAMIYIDLEHFVKQYEHIKYMFFRNNLFSENAMGIVESTHFDNDIRDEYKKRFRSLLVSLLYSMKDGAVLTEPGLKKTESLLIYSMVNEFNWLKYLRITNKYFVSSVQLSRYHRTIKYIDEHYFEKITLEDIISREHVTKTYFSHFWKTFTSFSFRDRLNYERVIRSEFLLLNNENISLISELCGFSDVKYYYRYFNKWYGCMPKKHKARCDLYEKKGDSYKVLDIAGTNSLLENYSQNFQPLQSDQDSDRTAFIENYMKLNELYQVEKGMKSSVSKSIVIDPFQYSDYLLDRNTLIFDWQNMDLCVNLSLDLGFTLHLRLDCNRIEKGYFRHTLSSFIEGCIFRYGLTTVKRWHFIVSYKDIAQFNEVHSAEGPFGDRVNDMRIHYSFEL